MLGDRRALLVLLAAVLVGVPAGVMAALCVGNACADDRPPDAEVPFCSLPRHTRSLIAAGFRDDRSPHVLAVTAADAAVAGADEVDAAPWPSEVAGDDGTVPLVFAGTGATGGARVPDGTTLDAVAPTIAEAIGLRRPHPEVRSGEAIGGVASGEQPRLVLEVVWRGVGSRDLQRSPRRWPILRGLLESGSGTLAAEVGSRPLDPAAVLATIGTGGLPRDHGITGTHVRDDDGEPVLAYSHQSPFSVIAALGDDLDEVLDQEPRIGLVGMGVSDTGLVGGNWYVDGDRDDAAFARRPVGHVRAARELLAAGYGDDETPDLLGVTMQGSVRELDAALGELVAAAEAASGGSVLVAVTSTGSMHEGEAMDASQVAAQVERRVGADVVAATAVGGLFLDQDALQAANVTDDRAVVALRDVRAPDGAPAITDAFPALAVTFARYC